MTVSKDDGETIVAVGDTLSYDIAYENTSSGTASPGRADGVTIVDTLPTGTTFLGCSFGGGGSGNLQ